jgi:phosphoglycolate phosphatase
VKRAALFDLDGTLLDSLADIADAMNGVLAEHGLPTHPLPPYRQFVGDGLRMLVRRALPDGQRDDETIERCVAAMKRLYGERLFVKTAPYPGVAELLDQLQQRNLVLAVLSNKHDGPTRELVDHFFGLARFATVQGKRDGVPLKPDPTAAIAIASQLEIPAQQWLYLGDTSTDMQTANAAGMVAVGVRWGFRDADELRQAGAQHLISHPRELLELL